MKHTSLFIVAVLASFLTRAACADNIYVTMAGVNGSVTAKGHERSIEATAFSLDVSTPTSATGAKTGTAKTTFTLTLNVDSSSQALYEMSSQNKSIANVTVEIFGPAVNGVEKPLMTIKLADVEIAHIDLHTKAGAVPPTPIVDMTLDARTIEVSVPVTSSAADADQPAASGARSEISNRGGQAPRQPVQSGG